MVKIQNTGAKPEVNIKPLFNNVLIRPLEAEEKTSGGIYLPEKKPVTVKVGQKVMYKKWGGNEIKVGNEEWTIVEEKDILAVVG